MKIAIIGAGVMGGSIARGLAKGISKGGREITVSDPSRAQLERIKTDCPAIKTTSDNVAAVADADIVFIVVKPWLVKDVVTPLGLAKPKIMVSVAAGVTIDTLSTYVDPTMPIFRIIPNTAISEGASMTVMASRNTTEEQVEGITALLSEMGMALPIDEKLFPTATALTSCGIAYVFKYVQAAMQAAVEGGFRPKEAQLMLAQTLEGAALMLKKPGSHPSLEIDKVSTPGGLTIKGINELEHNGFSSAIIKAINKSKN